ncbi:hypothetical protein TSHO111613_24800 [Tsukamurella hominis]
MHGGEADSRPDGVVDGHRQSRPAAPAGDPHPRAVGETEPVGVLRVELEEGRGVEAIELGDTAGLGHGVPLVREATGGEDQRVLVVRQLRGRQVRAGEEARAARRRREPEAPVLVEVADRVPGGPARRRRPLHGALREACVVDAAHVPAGAGIVEGLELLEDRRGVGIIEVGAVTELGGDQADQLPIGERVAGRRGRGGGAGEGALRVDHHAVGLGPERGGQHDVGVGGGLGGGVGVLHDHQLRRAKGVDHGGPVGHRRRRVAADDPRGLDVPGRELPIHLDGALAGLGADRALRQAPEGLGAGAVAVVEDGALAGQAGSHVAHLAAAHRVRLAGQAERARAGAADRAGGQVQVAERDGVPRAVGGLVQAHGPQAGPVRGAADEVGGALDVGRVESGDLGDAIHRIVLEEGGHRVPALGVRVDELPVHGAAGDEQREQAVEQREVGARADRQVQVGLRRGRGAPRVDHDQLRARLDPVHHAQEQDRVAVGHVGAGDEEDVGVVEVVVTAGRPVGAEGLLVARSRARHAQPGVGLDPLRAQEALRQLGREVLRLQRHLPAHVQGDRVGPVRVPDLPQAPSGRRDRVRELDGAAVGVAVRTHLRAGLPATGGEQVDGGGALGAQPSAVRGVVLRPYRTRDGTVAHLQGEAAAHPAVPAHRLHIHAAHGARAVFPGSGRIVTAT